MLQQWLRDRCIPVVATLVTEDAEQTCRRNNLSFEQLVSAFARLDGLKVPFRSASQQYTLESFAVRFVRGSDMRPYSTKEADLMLAEVAASAAEKVASAAEKAASAASAAATASQGGAEAEVDGREARRSETAGALLESNVENQEWYQRYRSKLWESLCHQEHEMLDCPAAVLVVVSSTEASGDPVACFDELSSPIYLPPPFQSRQYDPQSPALVYLLVHDWCRGAALGVDPDRVLSQMRGSFTAGQCRLLCINSLPPESPNLSQPDLWAGIVGENTLVKGVGAADAGTAADASTVRGALMSPEDILATKEFVRGLVSQVVVPSMERRIQSLNHSVSSVRKGVKNVLKSWWRKPREGVDTMMSTDGGGVAGGATYRYDRIESQIRLLADSAFLMRDYDTAASMYRMVRDDFKSDRAFLHYAAASEMLAISLYLLQGRASSGSGVSSPGSQINSLMSAASVGGVATPTARAVAAAAASVGHDLATFNGMSGPKSSIGSGGVGGGISLAVGGSQSAPNSGGVAGLNPAALLGRGREADTAFASALDAYQRRAAEDSVAAAAAVGSAGKAGVYPASGGGPGVEIGSVGGGRVGGGMSQAARLAARGAFLFADIAAAASEDRFASGMLVRSIGDPRGGVEILQAEAEEALHNASVQETPLTAALLLEVSAQRCRAARRARRASFRLVQAGHMYKEFSTARLAELRQEGKEKPQLQQHEKIAQLRDDLPPLQQQQHSLGIHAARCFLGALLGYQESGWLAAEEYTCTVLPAELRALQRPVAAIQLYVRLLSARGQGLRAESGDVRSGGSTGGGALHPWAQLAQQQQQQQLQKRVERERALMRALRDLCCGYPEAARIAASAWGRGRGSSRLDMTYFPAVPRASATVMTPPITPTPSFSTVATAEDAESTRAATGDLLELEFDQQSGDDNAGPGVPGGQGGGVEMGKGDAGNAGRDGDRRDIVFEGLSLPSVVHEQTRPVDTENASVQAVVESPDNGAWASDMAEALRAELAAAEAVRAGRGPWLTVSAAYGYQAGALPRDPTTSYSTTRRPSNMPLPPRSAPVGEPVTLLVVLENRLSIPVAVEDLQLDLMASSEASGAGGMREEETPVEIAAVDEKDFAACCASSGSLRGDDAAPTTGPSTPMVVVERKRATVGPGKRLPLLLKFCALRASSKVLTVSYVRWTVLGTSWSSSSSSSSPSLPSSPSDHPLGQAAVVRGRGDLGTRQASSPRVWIRHRLEGKGQLLHGTLEQRAARARAPAPPPRFEAMGRMPWLGCSLEGVPPTILQGEAVNATLRIINKGRAAAGDLCVKTNLPWVAFENSPREGEGGEDCKEGSGAPTGGAIGASGTTLLPPVGIIMPGETVELPVWLRGRGGGRQTVKMVVRYKRAQVPAEDVEGVGGVGGSGGESRKDRDSPVTPEEVLANPLFRMERHAPMSVEMCVLPSLSVAASVLPSYSRRGEYVLSLEATNYRTSGDEGGGNRHLRIHKVCAISRCWHMEPLAGHPSASSSTEDGAGGVDGVGTIVRWQERITLHYRLFPAEAEGEEGSAKDDGVLSVRHNDCALGLPGASIKEGSADSPHLPLLCLEQAASKHYVACRKHRQQKMVEAAAAAADDHPRTIQGVRQERERERAAAALRKEEEEEERRWRTQRHAHPTSPDALCSPELSLVHLMVLWGLDEAKEAPARRGQHHVRSLVIRPERVDRQCPLVLTVNYPSEVRWDKHASSFVGEDGDQPAGCDAEVMVCATNRLAGPGDDAKVNFTFEVRADDGPRRISTVPGGQPPSSTGAGQTPSSKRTPRNRFVWLGPTRRRVVGLGPGEAATIPLKVRFFRPGVFDLNRFRFVVEFSPPANSAGSASSAPPPSSGKGPSQASLSSNSLQSSSSSSSSAGATSASQPRSGTTSAQQQGRVTFVFPAQYLVTVAPASQLEGLPSRDVVDERAESIFVATRVRPKASARAGSSVTPMFEEVAVA